MSVVNCLTCGHVTNTTLCNYWDAPGQGATECYARKVNGRWERGCGYDQATVFEKGFADEIIMLGKED